MAIAPSHWWLVLPSLQNRRASSSRAPSILPTSLSHNHHFPANSSPSLHNRQFFPRNSCSSHRCQVGHLFPLGLPSLPPSLPSWLPANSLGYRCQVGHLLPLGLPSLPPSLPSWLPANSLGYYSHLHHNHFQCFLSLRLAWPCNQRYTGPASRHQPKRRCRRSRSRLGGQW